MTVAATDNVVRRTIGYAGLTLLLLVFAFPFYNMFVLATHESIFADPPHIWFGAATGANLAELFDRLPFVRNFLTSVGIAVLATGGTVFFCTMGGFALSKYQFRGREAFFGLMLLTMAIPPFLNIIPFFRMMVAFGWYNTWLPLIVPGLANAFGIFLMRQYIDRAVPGELLDAARVDGMGEFRILLRVVFPLAQNGIAVLATVTFIGSWNNFLGALVMLPDPQRTTIPVALSSLFVQTQGNYGAMMMGNALAVLPVLAIYLAFSRRIIDNLAAGSVKG